MHQRKSIQTIDGSIYEQKDAVAMGSPQLEVLLPTVMCPFWEITGLLLLKTNKAYVRAYVYDIILVVNSVENIREIKQKMENGSVLKFTY